MKNTLSTPNPIMKSINRVYRYLKKDEFSGVNDLALDIALSRVRGFLHLSADEAAVFSFLFVNYFAYGEKPITIGMLASDAEITPIIFLSFRAAFTSLEEKGYIYADATEDSTAHAKAYRIPHGVTDAIVQNDAALLAKGLRLRDRELVYPDAIAEKTVFYPESITGDIASLTTYLEAAQFSAIQTRLIEKAMGKGVNIMFHGESGTGKTETVFQIARKTNRALLHIDIGSMVSCWHGGTEHNLSLLFERYERLCKQAASRGENIPILLFNEADALFGRRLEPPLQAVEIGENHIQSILLEKQPGILIVTTNLAGNFDRAFERRFLFKIKFEKPDLAIKKRIWKDKVQWLKKPALDHLAESYALSGAEIDNVVRKATMQEVLTGKRSSVKEIESFCQKEKLAASSRKPIGFNH